MSTTTTTTNNVNLDERDRQLKQAEMIRQYLQMTNIESNPSNEINSPSSPPPSLLPPTTPVTTTPPPMSFNFDDLRKDLQMAEERVERLRQEVKELQKKRDESSLRPPPPYVSPSFHPTVNEFFHHPAATLVNQRSNDRPASPAVIQDIFSSPPSTRSTMTNGLSSSSFLLNNLNLFAHLPVNSGGIEVSKDERHRQFLLTMHQHREQLLVYLESLKQALNSLDRLASLEPSRSEIHLANMKLDTIQQKSRQLRALKSTRSSQSSPFIECRIRQLERDLVHMLSEHQKDIQAKLELNEQRSLMLFKIMQVTDELTSLDQQIQQILSPTNVNSSPSTFDLINGTSGNLSRFHI